MGLTGYIRRGNTYTEDAGDWLRDNVLPAGINNRLNNAETVMGNHPNKVRLGFLTAYGIGDAVNGFQTTDAMGDFVWNMGYDSASRVVEESTDWVPVANIPDAFLDWTQREIEENDETPGNNLLYLASSAAEIPFEMAMDPTEFIPYDEGISLADAAPDDTDAYNRGQGAQPANPQDPGNGGAKNITEEPTADGGYDATENPTPEPSATATLEASCPNTVDPEAVSYVNEIISDAEALLEMDITASDVDWTYNQDTGKIEGDIDGYSGEDYGQTIELNAGEDYNQGLFERATEGMNEQEREGLMDEWFVNSSCN